MIERVNQQRTLRWSEGLWGTARTYNFPRASLLECTFRLLPPKGALFTNEVLSGVRLTFGVGNPPDFGLGNTQTVTIPIPSQEPPLAAWENDKKSAEAAVEAAHDELTYAQTVMGTPGVSGSGLLEALAYAAQAWEGGTPEEKEGALGTALIEAQIAVKNQEGVINSLVHAQTKATEELEKIEIAKPSGWTAPVSASFSRSFEALRIVLPSEEPFFYPLTFEETIVVSRPEDIGPTYTQPFSSVEGG